MNYQALFDELRTDPQALRYAPLDDTGPSDNRIADILNKTNRPAFLPTMTPAQLVKAISGTEYLLLSEATRSLLALILSLVGDIPISGQVLTNLQLIFVNSPNTMTNLAAALTTTVSRAVELGLGPVNVSDVSIARRGPPFA